MSEVLLFAAIFFPIAICPLFFLLQRAKFRSIGLISTFISAFSLTCVLLLWWSQTSGEGSTYVVSWVPSLGVDLSFLVDGLSLFFGMLVTAMGVLINFYANYYMDPDDEGIGRFYCCLTFFMGAMLGTVFSDNLMILYTFWELTGIASFLLISYHRESWEAAKNARLSLLVTFATGLCLFIGIVLIGILDETFSYTEIISKGINFTGHEFWSVVIVILFLVGIFGKSVQLPFHFWLPKAMVAPIPVSSYLHAATMVKLGIFLTARVYPLFITSELWYPLLTSVCYATMLFGAIFALLSNDLKAVLAYATISQLGFFLGFYGMGGVEGVQFDFIHIFNHALYKGSLFMLVGIISKATEIRDIRYLGGLWNHLPLTTVSFFLAAGAMAGVPGTSGFLSKELILTDILGRVWDPGAVVIFVVLISAMIFKVAFSVRLFYHLFIRPKGEKIFDVKKPSFAVQVSPLILSSTAFIFGVWPEGLKFLTGSFFVTSLHLQESIELTLLHGWQMETFVSFAILAAGLILFMVAEKFNLWWTQHKIPDWGGFWERVISEVPGWAMRITGRVHPQRQNVYLMILMGGFFLVIAIPFWASRLVVRPISFDMVRFVVSLIILVSTLGAAIFRKRLPKLLSLSTSGFLVTFYFVLYAAPDLAMTQILVEVATLLILVIVFFITGEGDLQFNKRGQFLRVLLSLGVGGAAAWSSWAVYNPYKEATLPIFFSHNSWDLAHGQNLVNTILVDFRGLDTLGETAVLVISALGVWGMLKIREGQRFSIYLIPSILLKAMIPMVFLLINLLAIHLLFRGHNYPGGGFIAGLASGISVILLSMIYQADQILSTPRLNLLRLGSLGLLFMMFVSLFPLLGGAPLLTHYVLDTSTPLFFDIGVYLAVVGVVIKLYFSMRIRMVGDVDYVR